MLVAALLLLGVVMAPTSTIAGPPCPDGMIRVPGGPFWMGSDAAERTLASKLSSPETREARWFDAELTREQVTISAFCIDRTLVSQAQYGRFVAATGHREPGITRSEYRQQGFLVHDYEREVTPYLWAGTKPPIRFAHHPAVLVSAADAEAYCRWRAFGLRLPTEAEWEEAARGDRGSIFPWGDAWDPTRANSAASGVLGTTPVTRYPNGASPYGMLDAVGNVFQWTGTSLGVGRRVLKGCGWDDDAGLCRPAFRHGRPAESRHILIGFRCAGR
ncbi:MAG: formylglycine-generating enzyme family protein [Candidatus Rokuibacteriota bacterium]